MGKGVETSVVFESVTPAGALNSVALHHCLTLRTGVLPCLQLVSIFLVSCLSSPQKIMLACLPSSEHHWQRWHFCCQHLSHSQDPGAPMWFIVQPGILLRASEHSANQGLNGLVSYKRHSSPVDLMNCARASGQGSLMPYTLSLWSSSQHAVGIYLVINGWLSWRGQEHHWALRIGFSGSMIFYLQPPDVESFGKFGSPCPRALPPIDRPDHGRYPRHVLLVSPFPARQSQSHQPGVS